MERYMKNIVVFKTTGNNLYALDGFTNMITQIDAKLADVLNCNEAFDRELIYTYASENLRNIMDKWRLFEKIEPNLNYEDVMEQLIYNPYPQLILNLTQNCNLRCKYCIFSGKYEGYREHATKQMSIDIAKKSIDRFIGYVYEWQEKSLSKSPIISFYGGEALLEFNLIKEIVAYIKSVNFSPMLCLTTNGVLLDEEKIKFLVDNNVIISVSLDGPKELHDKNRVLSNELGTYEIVHDNIAKLQAEIKKQNKSHLLPILILTCYEDCTDLHKLNQYFVDNQEFLGATLGRVSKIIDFNLKEDVKKENTPHSSISELFNNYLENIEKYQGDSSKLYFLERLFGNLLKGIYIRSVMPNGNKFTSGLGGICVPGTKISVSTEGIFYVCEKANEHFPIGDYEQGLDQSKIKLLLEKWHKSFYSYCGDCAFKGVCGPCFATCNDHDEFNISSFCGDRKEGLTKQFSILFSLLEKNPEIWKHLTENENLKNEMFCSYSIISKIC